MGKQLPPDKMELYRRCDEVLHYVWDPIGVAGIPGARGEYDSYLPKIFALVADGADKRRIEDHLVNLEKTSMGLSGNRKRARTTVERLLEWRDWISEKRA